MDFIGFWLVFAIASIANAMVAFGIYYCIREIIRG